jgi:hypothetical protein
MAATSMNADVTAGETELSIAGGSVTVGWRGRALLRGFARVEPAGRGAQVLARPDGDTVHVEVRVEPAPTAAVVAAWLDLSWNPDVPPPLRAWVPHLRPGEDDVIAEHAFRSPVAAIENRDVRLVLLPDVEMLAAARALPGALDLDMNDPRGARLAYGLCASRPAEHMWFRRNPAGGTTQRLRFGLRILAESTHQPIESSCARWVWRHVGASRALRARTQALPFTEHARRAADAVFVDEWIATQMSGGTAGGPIHYNDSGTAVFFQAWFNALRSAVGLALLGKRLGRNEYLARARQVAVLADAMPAGDLLPTLYDHERQRWWGVGDDVIFAWAGRDETALRFYHLPDTCETAKWMLAWHELVEPRPSFVARIQRLARFLACVQAENGSIPSYFEQGSLNPGARLRSVAQCAIAGPILLYGRQHAAAARLGDFLCREVVPTGRYFDYETFLSCSYKPLDFADPHTLIPPQNTLSMSWTAECLLRLARSPAGSTEQRAVWLAGARCALDQLCLYQQLWEPPFLSYRAFGGFGVMNTDGEWSDARQAPFGLLLLEAYRGLGDPEYFLRGVAALRAAFALQAIPENRDICPTIYDGACPNWPRDSGWDYRWDHPPAEMRKLPPGKSVENYGHGGYDSPGVRSGFDWGEGSAAACAMIATQRFGDVFIDPARGTVFGIDGVNAVPGQDGFDIEDMLGRGCALRVRVEDHTAVASVRDGAPVWPGTRVGIPQT